MKALWNRRAARLGALALALGSARTALARPTIWDIVKQPELARADQLLAVAERSRVPASGDEDDIGLAWSSSTSDELERQLNARAAALITIADGATLGDSRLLYLLGDALVRADASHLDEARLRLRQALEQDPSSPLAASAWFSLALAEGKLGDHDAEQAAYTQALAYEWDEDNRSVVLTNRAESAMAEGELAQAIRDYQSGLAKARSGPSRALALWGLAVATERDGDLPAALAFAREASRLRFGTPTRPLVALDLPSVYFTPDYEEHYYRALATLGEALAESRPDAARLAFQTASLLWSLYIEGAERDGARWLENAKRHRERCRRALERIDAARPPGAPGSGSKSGRDED